MSRIIRYIGQEVFLSDYEEKHRPHLQKQIGGINIDHCLRTDFVNTPNEERERQEILNWWGRPYIFCITWDQFKLDDTQCKKAWFESWPSGNRFDVRCLDGGAWDRSTCWGSAETLDEAIAIVKAGPGWIRGLAWRR